MSIIKNIKDIRAFLRFKSTIKAELNERDSKMNKYGIKSNTLGNILYVQLNCDNTDYINASYNEDTMLYNKMYPIVEYLNEELDFGEYLVPHVTNFIDEETNTPTFSYGIMYIFMGKSLTFTKFIIHSILWILFIIICIVLICHFLI